MALVKKNGKWVEEFAATAATQDTYGGRNQGELIPGQAARDAYSVDLNEADSNQLELATSRYGSGFLAEPSTDFIGGVFGGSSKATIAKASSLNAGFDAQAKLNEPLRGSALSMANTFAQSAAMTAAREAGTSNVGSTEPQVTLKKKGAPAKVSSTFRI